jgi:hypothetical protein
VAAACNGTFAYVVNQGSGSFHRVDMDDKSAIEYAAGQFDEALSIGAFIGDTSPSAPSGLTAKALDDDVIRLKWIDNSTDEVGFKIERRKQNQTKYTQVATIHANKTSYDDDHLAGDTVYHYRVRAYKEASDSAYSASANAKTDSHSATIHCFINAMSY